MKHIQPLSTLILIMLIISLSMNARSQILISLLLGDKLNSGKIEFGLNGGFNRTYLNGLDEAKGLSHFNLGFYFDIKLKKKWFLNTGVLVKSNMGAAGIPVYTLDNDDLDSAFLGGEIQRKLNYFNVPIEIKYIFRNYIFIDAGFMVSLRYKSYDYFYNEIEEKDDVSYRLEIGDQIKRLDAGVIGGMGFKLTKGIGMSFGAKYYYGLVDIFKDDRNSRNSALYIYANIPIGSGKASKNQEPENKQE